ncbi:uncharacterized protein [Prorops nasuta]|uniref:uncharacterized protein n=1 Tax=Prorops nasuta TaxID=863751 RepID=UPI0034CE78B4
MLKKTLNTKSNVDISKFHNLKSLIKNNSKGYKPKKSLVLKWDEIMEFINNAPDYVHLVSKVILIFGICGALRCDEITKLKVQDVEDLRNKYLVSINDTKNDQPRQFIIGEHFYEKIKLYISMKPDDMFTDRFFIQYHKGKCEHQVIGRNKIGETPQMIASYLKLPNPKLYTGHCFRRTGATLLSNSGANVTMLKQLGGWKSTNIAQGYIENSLNNRQKIYESIIPNAQSNPETSTSNNRSINIINSSNDKESTCTTKNFNNFTDDFEINDEDLAAIDKISQSPAPSSFATANNKNMFTNCDKERRSTHFTTKPPIKVFPERSVIKPLQQSNKTIEKESQVLSTNPAFNQIPQNKYEKCVFHGNIINNFYYSCCDHKNYEKENLCNKKAP